MSRLADYSRWIVWSVAALLSLQPLFANCCFCTCSTHQETCGEDARTSCDYHSHCSHEGSEGNSLGGCEPDGRRSVVFCPCNCPPTCPCQVRHAPQPIAHSTSSVVLPQQSTDCLLPPPAILLRTAESAAQFCDCLAVSPRLSALGQCAALCRFNI